MGTPTLIIGAGHKPGGGARSGTWTEGSLTAMFVSSMQAWAKAMQIHEGLGGVVFVPNDLDLAETIVWLNRVMKPSTSDGDLCAELHLDYSPSPGIRGSLALVDETIISQEASRQFLADWCTRTGIPNTGIHDNRRWATTQRGWPAGSGFAFDAPAWPGTIIELGFITNPTDRGIITSAWAPQAALDYLWNAWLRVRDARK